MPVVDTTQSFSTGDTVTSTTLNNIMDQSIFVAGAVVTGDGLTVTAGGQMTIENLKVTGAKIGNLEVSTEKIANASITPAKLSSGGPSWTGTGAGGVFSVPQTGLEFGTGHTQDFGCFIDLHAAATPTDFETRIVRDGGVNGAFRVINNGTGAITFSASGGVTFDSGGVTFGSANMPTPSGNAPIYGVRAWVNFNGTTTANISGIAVRNAGSTTATITITNHGLLTGHRVYIDFGATITDSSYDITKVDNNTFTIVTGASTAVTTTATVVLVSIRGQGNVSCVSRASTGVFLINFTVAMPNAFYAGSCSGNNTGQPRFAALNRTDSTSQYAKLETEDAQPTPSNFAENSVIIVG